MYMIMYACMYICTSSHHVYIHYKFYYPVVVLVCPTFQGIVVSISASYECPVSMLLRWRPLWHHKHNVHKSYPTTRLFDVDTQDCTLLFSSPNHVLVEESISKSARRILTRAKAPWACFQTL